MRVFWSGIVTLPLLLALTACGPILMIPGGELGGTVTAAPDDWSFTDEVGTVQLETRPGDPYSVNIWCTSINGQLMIGTDRSTAWAGYIAADPRVRLRVDGAIYELVATPTVDPRDAAAFQAAIVAKYDYEPDPEQQATAVQFWLSPR